MGFRIVQKTPFIKKVNHDYVPESQEVLFYRDNHSGVIFRRKRRFGSSTARDPYAVNVEKIHEQRGFQKTIEDLDGSKVVPLLINCKFQFTADLDLELVRKLITAQQEDRNLLEEFLFQWIEEYINDTPDFIRNFIKKRTALSSYLEDRASVLGVKLEVVIKLKNDPGDHHTITGEMDIRAGDYSGKVRLAYNVDLELISGFRIQAVMALSNAHYLEGKIKKGIRDAINKIEKIKMQALVYSTHAVLLGSVENKLKEVLKDEGFLPVFVDLQVDTGDLPSEYEQINYPVTCVTKNGHEVLIDHKLILHLVDLGKYFAAEVGDLREWIEQELLRTTQVDIFEKDFTSLMVNFNDSKIKSQMKSAVEAIGYEIKQLITIPDLQKIIPKSVEIEIGEGIEFATKRDEHKVKLGVVITGQINDVSKLTWLLSPNLRAQTIIEKTRDAVINVIRQFMHSLEPEKFYMGFDLADNEHKVSPSDRLISAIEEKLKSDFGIIRPDIICKRLETNLIKKITDLHGRSYQVKIALESMDLRYEIPVEVSHVDTLGWSTFKAKCDGLRNKDPIELLKEISVRVKHMVEPFLKDWLSEKEKPVHQEFREKMNELLGVASKAICREFGLVVIFSNAWICEPDSKEILKAEKIKAALDTDKKILKRLEDARLERAKAIINQHTNSSGVYIEDEKELEDKFLALKESFSESAIENQAQEPLDVEIMEEEDGDIPEKNK